MNSCILMARIVKTPELRYTQDNQLAVTQMLVEFAGQRSEDPPGTLKVVGWGNLASEIQQNYTEGDRVILQGRLQMNVFDRAEGFKEKRAELTVSHIYKISALDSYAGSGDANGLQPKVVSINAKKPANTSPNQDNQDAVSSSSPLSTNIDDNLPDTADEKNLDDIPF